MLLLIRYLFMPLGAGKLKMMNFFVINHLHYNAERINQSHLIIVSTRVEMSIIVRECTSDSFIYWS